MGSCGESLFLFCPHYCGEFHKLKSSSNTHLRQIPLLRAIEQTERAARDLGIYALLVHALDDRARDWYLGLGFGFGQ